MRFSTAPRRSDGFTLIELMIVVVIATILISIAVPSYMQQIRQSRRTEAKTALLDAAGREERYFSTNGSSYTNVATQLGYNAFPVPRRAPRVPSRRLLTP
jgi:type IV pilus assembly protein PilE